MRLDARPNDPGERCDLDDIRVERLGHLCPRDVHGRLWLSIEAGVAHITDYSHDLPCGFCELRTCILADDDAIGQRVASRPVLSCHRLVDDHHPRRAFNVAICECATPKNEDLERAEIRR